MRKILVFFTALFVLSSVAGAETKSLSVDAQEIISKLEKAGITGKKAKYGLSKKIFKILTLENYDGIVSDNYSVGVYGFNKAWGFDRAVDFFQMLTLVSQTEVYKERPYIITIEGETKEGRDAAVNKIKKTMPHIREISEEDR